MARFYVHRNPGNKVFVKTEDFFIEQGGLDKGWGHAWTLVEAKNIEDARRIGEETLPLHVTNFARIKDMLQDSIAKRESE